MTNLERVTILLKNRNIATKQERKEAIDLIVSNLEVSRSNAAVYLSKVQKLSKPIAKPIPQTQKEIEQELQITNDKIAAIIEKANNAVYSV